MAAEHANSGQELGMLRKRHAKIVASFPEATPGIRKALAQEAVKLEAEIERLSVGLGSLGGELRAVFKDISALAYEVSRAQRMLVDPTTRPWRRLFDRCWNGSIANLR